MAWCVCVCEYVCEYVRVMDFIWRMCFVFCVFGVSVCVGVFGFWVLFLDVFTLFIRIRHLW